MITCSIELKCKNLYVILKKIQKNFCVSQKNFINCECKKAWMGVKPLIKGGLKEFSFFRIRFFN
ncbi:MAG: hypothetical protein DUD26_04130 [Eubacteriaceae bacterium]|nr:MAG: hypothetical protein DUD26_04130 [Eubacteriaceae bacterium]